MLYLFLFLSFFQAGLLSIGGSPVSVAWLEHEILTLHHWLTPSQMADLMVMCRFLPGGTGVNAATLTGAVSAFARYGFWGGVGASAVSMAGLCLPSLLWVELFTRLKTYFSSSTLFTCVMTLLRPLLPGLIFAASILLMRADCFGTPNGSPWSFYISIFLFLSTLVGHLVFRFNAFFLILLCGVAGMILF